MESEINKVIGNFDSMISSFDNNFTELKAKLQSLEDKFDKNEKYLKTLNS
jgi:peptidoglycan hydrolase CwlO-like protein